MQTNSSACFVFVTFRHLPLLFFLLFWICMRQRRNKKKIYDVIKEMDGRGSAVLLPSTVTLYASLFHPRVKQIGWRVWKTYDYSPNIRYFPEKFQARGSIWAEACTRRLAAYDVRPGELTLGSVLCHDGHGLACVLQGGRRLLVRRTGQIHAVYLRTHTHTQLDHMTAGINIKWTCTSGSAYNSQVTCACAPAVICEGLFFVFFNCKKIYGANHGYSKLIMSDSTLAFCRKQTTCLTFKSTTHT